MTGSVPIQHLLCGQIAEEASPRSLSSTARLAGASLLAYYIFIQERKL